MELFLDDFLHRSLAGPERHQYQAKMDANLEVCAELSTASNTPRQFQMLEKKIKDDLHALARGVPHAGMWVVEHRND